MLDISFIELIKTFKTMNERLKRILLWIAVIPGAIIAGILILFPVHWVLYQTLTNFIDPYPEAPEKY
jgi:ABC-type sugar transport system permease subunit